MCVYYMVNEKDIREGDRVDEEIERESEIWRMGVREGERELYRCQRNGDRQK